MRKARRIPVLIRVLPEDLELIDKARGRTPRSRWISTQAALAALEKEQTK